MIVSLRLEVPDSTRNALASAAAGKHVARLATRREVSELVLDAWRGICEAAESRAAPGAEEPRPRAAAPLPPSARLDVEELAERVRAYGVDPAELGRRPERMRAYLIGREGRSYHRRISE